jgi:hypothetical protein
MPENYAYFECESKDVTTIIRLLQYYEQQVAAQQCKIIKVIYRQLWDRLKVTIEWEKKDGQKSRCSAQEFDCKLQRPTVRCYQ